MEHDGVLNLEWPNKVTTIAYTDDLVVLVETEDIRHLMFKTNEGRDQSGCKYMPHKSL